MRFGQASAFLTPPSDSDRSRFGYEASGPLSSWGAFAIELSEPFTLPPIGGCGDVVARSPYFSGMPLRLEPPFVKVEAEFERVPSEVWMFLPA